MVSLVDALADDVDWFLAFVVLELLVGAVPQQELDGFEPVEVCCTVQRGAPVLILELLVGAVPQQELDNFEAASACCT